MCEQPADAEQAGNSASLAHNLLLLEHQLARRRKEVSLLQKWEQDLSAVTIAEI